MTLLHAADELHATSTLSDATWAALAERYDTEQLIELPMLVGHYHLVAMALNSFGVELDEGLHGLSAVNDSSHRPAAGGTCSPGGGSWSSGPAPDQRGCRPADGQRAGHQHPLRAEGASVACLDTVARRRRDARLIGRTEGAASSVEADVTDGGVRPGVDEA